MHRTWRLAAVALAASAVPALAQDRPPPGCRWQSGDGGEILACKDSQGYWRRSGDDEIVGYDPPPRTKPRPPAAPRTTPAATTPASPTAVPSPTTAPAPPPAPVPAVTPAPAAPVVAEMAEPAPAAVPAPPTAPAAPAEPTAAAPAAKPGFFAVLWAKIVAWWEGLKAYFVSQF